MRTPAPLLLAILLLAGCGGGGSSHSGGTSGGSTSGGDGTANAAQGTATVTIKWPTRAARFVPLSSNGVVVTLSLDGVQAGRQVLARPADGTTSSTATFTGLRYGAYAVSLAAVPNADGTGVPQAEGATTLKVKEDGSASASVSLVTTVAALTIVPVAFDKNATATVSVGAIDAQGDAVLLAVGAASEAVTWSIDPVVDSLGRTVPAATLSSTTGATITLTGVHSGATQLHVSVGLGLSNLLIASGAVTVNAIADGTGTVTVS